LRRLAIIKARCSPTKAAQLRAKVVQRNVLAGWPMENVGRKNLRSLTLGGREGPA
jgi:hypothetical protein